MNQVDLTLLMEESNLELAKRILDTRLDYIEVLHDLYDRILENYAQPCRTGQTELTPRQKLFMQAGLSCRYQLIVGTTTLLKGHKVDSLSNLRRALEYTIFAARAVENPKAANLWLQADNNWKEYRNEFKIFYLVSSESRAACWKNLTDALPKLIPIFELYELISKYVHATVLSAGPFNQKGKEIFVAPLVDVEPLSNSLALVEPFFQILSAHLLILKVHYSILLKAAGSPYEPIIKTWEDKYQLATTSIDEAFRDLPDTMANLVI